MIMNELQTMPYYFSDEIASKPYNHHWDCYISKFIVNQIILDLGVIKLPDLT
jgi:hypothetical protein